MASHTNAEESLTKFYGLCAYPSCPNRKMSEDEPFVEWHSAYFTKEQVEDNLSPMSKLAVIANPTDFVEKYGKYGFNIQLHPECAAEWGMHLIRDSIDANRDVGSKLRGTRNALRKQTQTV
jgi:hypothetical protein